MTFTLTMSFSATDLQNFKATGSNVVIAKPLTDGVVNVAWIVFSPFPTNHVSWEENYDIYGSNAEITDHTALLVNANNPGGFATAGTLYTMIPDGAITGPAAGGTPGAFSILNHYSNLPKGHFTFGLRQAAMVNEAPHAATALSATAILLQSSAVLTPASVVYLWLQPNLKSNTVVTTVTGPQTQVTLTTANPSANLSYDPGSGTFLPVAGGTRTKVIAARL